MCEGCGRPFSTVFGGTWPRGRYCIIGGHPWISVSGRPAVTRHGEFSIANCRQKYWSLQKTAV